MAVFTGDGGANILDGDDTNDTLNGLGGADTLSGDYGADVLHGGAGDDIISGFRTGSNAIYDDGSVDRLFGEDGNDYLGIGAGDLGNGGTGNDTLVAGGAGTFAGGAGADVLRVGSGYDIAGSVISGIERLEASNGSNGAQMRATEFNSFGMIAGFDGSSAIHLVLTGAGTGTANIHASVSEIDLDGSAENDNVTLVTAGAVATMSGDYGADVLHGGAGDDIISGFRTGSNAIYDDGSVDRLFGEDGNDYLGIGAGDLGNGGTGNDTLVAGGAGTFAGGAGDDVLRVGSGYDIAGSVISGIERLEASNGSNGAQMRATEFNSFGTIAGFDGSSAIHLVLTGAGTGTANIHASVSEIDLDGSAENDNVTLVTAGAVATMSGDYGADVLHGGAGDDIISGFRTGSNAIYDDGSVDRLFGEDGNDYLGIGAGDLGNGGTGNDTLVAGGAGTFAGGAGDDVLRVGSGYDIAGSVISGIERLEASNGSNGAQMRATEFNSFGTIAGFDGSSAIHLVLTGAGTGTANIHASVSEIDLDGSAENDNVTLVTAGAVATMSGDYGADVLHGGAGDDIISGFRTGSNAIYDDGAVDRLFGDGGDDLIGLSTGDFAYGGEGNDTLQAGGWGNLYGEAGNDLLIGSSGNDFFYGAAGSDTVSYQATNSDVRVDLLVTAAQNTQGGGFDTLSLIENLIGGGGDDTLFGTGAANIISGGEGDDIIDGRGGSDTAGYAAGSGAVFVDLRLTGLQDTGGQGTDRLTSIENLIGGAGNDTLYGTGAANVIEGGAGDDLLYGLGGNDTASYAGAGAGVRANLGLTGAQNTVGAGVDTLTSFESLRGSAFADSLTGGTGANLIEGGAGNDTLTGGDGIDTLTGGDGNDAYINDGADIFTEAANGGTDRVQSATAYTLVASFENLTLTGTAGVRGTGNTVANAITGNSGANTLIGLAGDDTLTGGAGDDTLTGGTGVDRLVGGTGSDFFVFNLATDSAATNPDVIAGFDGAGAAAGDWIDLSEIDANSALAGDQSFVLGSTGIRGLSLVTSGTDTLVQGNTDADAAFEFVLRIADGATGAGAYAAADFIL